MSVITTENITAKIASSIQQQLNVQADPMRTEALNTFLKLGLPALKNEEYKYTPITRLLEKSFSFSPSPSAGPIGDLKEFFIPGLDANVIVFIDGVFSKDHSAISSKGVTVSTLEEALTSNNKIAIDNFSKYVNTANDSILAWNRAAWNHGMFIHVPDNTIVDKPFVFYHIVNGTAGEIISINRNLFVVGKSSELTVIEKFDSKGNANHFLNLVTEAVVNENATFNFYSIQNDSNNRYQHALTEIYQKNSSRVNTYTASLQGKLYRNNLNLQLDGEGIESHMYGLYLLDKDTIADNHSVVDHKKPNSFSNELYKGVMDGSSRGVFNGKIFVRPQAQKTNAFQANRNILLSDKANVNTKPQLEIWADDVKCSHGCTTGQLDEEAVFYLQSRGIDKEAARGMMLYAFAGEVIDQIKHPVLKEYLDGIISTVLHKNF